MFSMLHMFDIVLTVRVCLFAFIFFFFKQKTAYEMRISDWSSDVCSSDLSASNIAARTANAARVGRRATSVARGRSPRSFPACAVIRNTPFPNPALITPWAGLHHPASQHRVGNLLESRDIGALHIVDISISLIAIRSEERRLGTACVSKSRSRWSP